MEGELEPEGLSVFDGLLDAADVPLALTVGLLDVDADFVLLAAHAEVG